MRPCLCKQSSFKLSSHMLSNCSITMNAGCLLPVCLQPVGMAVCVQMLMHWRYQLCEQNMQQRRRSAAEIAGTVKARLVCQPLKDEAHQPLSHGACHTSCALSLRRSYRETRGECAGSKGTGPGAAGALCQVSSGTLDSAAAVASGFMPCIPLQPPDTSVHLQLRSCSISCKQSGPSTLHSTSTAR